MTKLLVKYEDNWADEIDVRGFRLFDSREEYEEYLEYMEEDMPMSMYVGSNQEIDYSDIEDLANNLEVVEITDEQYDALKQLLVEYGTTYGEFPE